jgi:ABC-2 type transport system permease protein
MRTGIAALSSPRQSAHRVAALARAEGVLLRRNRIALLTALALPVAMVYSLKASRVLDAGGSRGVGAALLIGLTVFALLLPCTTTW